MRHKYICTTCAIIKENVPQEPEPTIHWAQLYHFTSGTQGYSKLTPSCSPGKLTAGRLEVLRNLKASRAASA